MPLSHEDDEDDFGDEDEDEKYYVFGSELLMIALKLIFASDIKCTIVMHAVLLMPNYFSAL